MNNNRGQRGFTLIEVLVASVILFSSVAVIGVLYKGSLVASVKAEKHLHMTSVVEIVTSKIEQLIRSSSKANGSLQGEIVELSVNVNWTAQIEQRKKAATVYDPEEGKNIEISRTYELWDVNLTLTYKGATQKYNFKVLAWSEADE